MDLLQQYSVDGRAIVLYLVYIIFSLFSFIGYRMLSEQLSIIGYFLLDPQVWLFPHFVSILRDWQIFWSSFYPFFDDTICSMCTNDRRTSSALSVLIRSGRVYGASPPKLL